MVPAGSRPSRAVQLDEKWVRELASQQWQLPSDSIKITDQGRQSPEDWGWLQKHRCLRLWALPGDRPAPAMTVLTTLEGQLRIKPEGAVGAPDWLLDEERVAKIAELFFSEGLSLPDALPPRVTATTFRRLIAADSVIIATAQHRGSVDSLFESADPDGEEQLADLVRRHCSDPVVQRQPQGWQLSFFAFNGLGMIEHWVLRGCGSKLDTAEFRAAAPAATGVPMWQSA